MSINHHRLFFFIIASIYFAESPSCLRFSFSDLRLTPVYREARTKHQCREKKDIMFCIFIDQCCAKLKLHWKYAAMHMTTKDVNLSNILIYTIFFSPLCKYADVNDWRSAVCLSAGWCDCTVAVEWSVKRDAWEPTERFTGL